MVFRYLILVPTVPTFYLLDVGLRLIPIRAGFPVYRKNQESTSLADSDQDLKWQFQSVISQLYQFPILLNSKHIVDSLSLTDVLPERSEDGWPLVEFSRDVCRSD